MRNLKIIAFLWPLVILLFISGIALAQTPYTGPVIYGTTLLVNGNQVDVANTTVNGTNCTPGQSCTPPSPAGTLTGTTLASNVRAAPQSWTGVQTFSSVIGTVSTQVATSYTLAVADCGTTVLFTNAGAITLTTLNSLPVGCSIAIEQGGAGQVTVIAGVGATQHSAHSYTATSGQYAILGLFVDTNAGGSAADFILTGDGV